MDTTIASGPVIIENGKVLLNKEQKKTGVTPWLFPGGKVENFDSTLEETCKREVKEEMGLEIEILRPLSTVMVHRPENPDQVAILVHYLAKRIGEIKPGENIVAWDWFDIHTLPDDCAPNIKTVIDNYLNEKV